MRLMLSAHLNLLHHKLLEDGLCNIIAFLIQYLEDFIGVEQTPLLLFIGFLLLLIPVPFVDLAGLETNSLCKILHEGSGPVGVLDVFIDEDLDLFFVLPPAFLLIHHLFIIILLLFQRLELGE